MSLRLALAVKLISWHRRLARSQGASGVEYGLMCALISAVILGGVGSVGFEISRVFTDLATVMATWAP